MSWFANVSIEIARRAFDFVLVTTGGGVGSSFVPGTITEVLNDTRWDMPQGLPVRRVAANMADAVGPMLRIADRVILVDPHFNPTDLRYRRTFEAFLSKVAEGAPPTSVEVQAAADKPSSPDGHFYKTQCESRLKTLIPRRMPVRFLRWNERPGGEPLHNRYILTDVGGVSFQHGLDEGSANETDDVNLLTRHQYDLRWSHYQSPSLAFDQAEAPFTIIG
jgi:hypothetical protein